MDVCQAWVRTWSRPQWFPWTRNVTLIVQYWLVPGTVSSVLYISRIVWVTIELNNLFLTKLPVGTNARKTWELVDMPTIILSRLKIIILACPINGIIYMFSVWHLHPVMYIPVISCLFFLNMYSRLNMYNANKKLRVFCYRVAVLSRSKHHGSVCQVWYQEHASV